MAVPRSTSPNRYRNVFITGIVIGALGMLILQALVSSGDVSKSDLDSISERLGAIEEKLSASPTPVPAQAATGGQTIAAINKAPETLVGQTVTVTGKVSSPNQGVGFILVDTDGSFLWVHTKDKIPVGTATVRGTVQELKDQLAQWKTEPGWPADDSALTAKLRNEKVFLEAQSVT